MKIINQKGKLFGIISILDIIIICLAIIISLGLFKYIQSYGVVQNSEEKQNITYDLSIKKLDVETTKEINIGDEVFDREKGYYRGVVQNIKIFPYKERTLDRVQGKFVYSEVPGYYEQILTIEVDAKVTDKEISISGNKLEMGNQAFILVNEKVYVSNVAGINITD